MALFNIAADANLPLLTKFFQVEPLPEELPEADEELLSLFEKTEMYTFLHEEWRRWFLARSNNSEQNIQIGLSLPFAAGFLDREFIYSYRDLHQLVRRIMQNFASGQLPVNSDLQKVAELLNQSSKPAGVWKFNVPADFPDTEPLPVSNLFLHPPRMTAHYKETYHAIVNELGDFFLNRKFDRIQRCSECKNPFMASRSAQKFCSYRCSARAGQRRRRAEAEVAEVATA